MAGVDTTLRHNKIRDGTYEHANVGALRSDRETVHLFSRPSASTEPSLQRPADVLIPHRPGQPNETLASGTGAALDLA
eukprot:1389944-Karenia_brevis.AAC.1